MKYLVIGSVLMSMTGTVIADEQQKTQVNLETLFTDKVQAQVLNQDEMKDTKAGATYMTHESIKGNVTVKLSYYFYFK